MNNKKILSMLVAISVLTANSGNMVYALEDVKTGETSVEQEATEEVKEETKEEIKEVKEEGVPAVQEAPAAKKETKTPAAAN
ncbi:MAG: hypothetical protein IKK88_03875, partial [Oscillospiraceae bacterium]|nr:hypothetical protein [Oscillospiraceae bacterium]